MTHPTEVLVFGLASVRAALPLAAVDRVVRAAALVPLAGAPAVVEGLLDLRGAPVPVVEGRLALGLPRRPLGASDHLVVVAAGPRRFALRVDGVHEVRTIDAEALVDPTHLVARVERVTGVVAVEDGLLLVHDPAAFLTGAEQRGLDAALAEASSC